MFSFCHSQIISVKNKIIKITRRIKINKIINSQMIMKIKTKKCYLIYFCAIFFMKIQNKNYIIKEIHTQRNKKKFNFKIKKMQQKNSLLNKKKIRKKL